MILKNELEWINEILTEYSSLSFALRDSYFEIKVFDERFNEVYIAWDRAVFSKNTDQNLKRYFQLHWEGILNILDTFPCFESADTQSPPGLFFTYFRNGLLALVLYLRKNFIKYLNLNCIIPHCIKDGFLSSMLLNAEGLKGYLTTARIDQDLRICLATWLDQLEMEAPAKRFTFSMLDYINNIISAIKEAYVVNENNATEFIMAKLSAANFNYLGFFRYRQIQIGNKLKGEDDIIRLQILQEERLLLKFVGNPLVIYENQWPGLKSMLLIWTAEEMVSIKARLKENANRNRFLNRQKLYQNIPVAHLALFTQLFHKENYFGDTSLTNVFKFMSLHYRTKRQDNISPGGLSKAYYSIDQITASRVKEQLQKMINRINHDFFPVWVAAILMIRF